MFWIYYIYVRFLGQCLCYNTVTEQMFLNGGVIMTKTEQELIDLIRSHPFPDIALEAAIYIISDYLMQPLSFEEQAAVAPQGPF